MPARSWAAALVVCSVAVGAPPLEVSPPLVADFDEWEVWHNTERRAGNRSTNRIFCSAKSR